MSTDEKRRRTRAQPGDVPGKETLARNGATRAMQLRVQQPRKDGGARFVLRLYVTGTTPASVRAIERVRSFCEEHLHGRYELEVIDIYRVPSLAKDDQIVATPTLIKVLPEPLRRFIGDLSRLENVLFGMDLRPRP